MESPQADPRKDILETLKLLASEQEQLQYHRRVPIANVSSELFCLWDEAFWPDDANLKTVFSTDEWQALLKFHCVFERVCRVIPHRLPAIAEFVRSPHWLQLSRAAERALRSIEGDV